MKASHFCDLCESHPISTPDPWAPDCNPSPVKRETGTRTHRAGERGREERGKESQFMWVTYWGVYLDGGSHRTKVWWEPVFIGRHPWPFRNHSFDSWIEACYRTCWTKYFKTTQGSHSEPSTETLMGISRESWNKQTLTCNILVPEQISGEWNARLMAVGK